MKKIVVAFFGLIILLAIPLVSETQSPQSLKEIYKTGKVCFSPEIVITNNSIPEDQSVALKYLTGLAVNEAGDVFAADVRSNHIFVFDKNGKFKKVLGQKGAGPGDLYYPTYIVYNKKRFIIWEVGNK